MLNRSGDMAYFDSMGESPGIPTIVWYPNMAGHHDQRGPGGTLNY